MKRVLGTSALGCMLVIAGVSCADALGLHDLTGGPTDAGGEGDSAAPSDAGSVTSGEDSALPSPSPIDADLVEAKVPTTSAPAPSPTGPTPSETSADAEPEMIPSRPDSSASSTKADAAPAIEPEPAIEAGAPVIEPDPTAVDAGGPAIEPGTPVMEAGAPEPVGGPVPPRPDRAANACGCPECVVHSNGVGDIFQDCVASGTHNAVQALEACSAFTGDGADCKIELCAGGSGGPGKTLGQAVCGTQASVCDCWAYAGAEVGLVKSSNGKCKPCASGGAAWD
jgi:hypothetical protein